MNEVAIIHRSTDLGDRRDTRGWSQPCKAPKCLTKRYCSRRGAERNAPGQRRRSVAYRRSFRSLSVPTLNAVRRLAEKKSNFSGENDGRTSEHALAGGFLARRTTRSVSSVSDGVCRSSWALLGCGTTTSGTRQMEAPNRDDVRLGLDAALPSQHLRRQKLAQKGRERRQCLLSGGMRCKTRLARTSRPIRS
jgi:hypothetical protein